jgi:hypothetical protein
MTTRTVEPSAPPGAAGAAAPAAAARAQQEYFRLTDRVPERAWYWAGPGAVASAARFLAGRCDWSHVVGQWPPAFLLLARFHQVLRPSR